MNGKAIAADAAVLGASGAVSQALAALRGVIGARVLGPEAFGIWQGVRLALRLAAVSHLGAIEALRREVPLARGANDPARAEDVRRGALAVALAGAALVAAGCAAGAAAAFALGRPALGAALLVGAAAALVQEILEVAIADLRAALRFRRSAAAWLVAAGTGALLAGPLAAALGAPGFVAAVALGSAAGVLVAAAGGGATGSALRGLRPRLRPGLARELVRIGWPIKLGEAAGQLRRNADKLVLLAVLGTGAAGLYGVADTLATVLATIPAGLAAVIAPHALESFGRSGDRRALAGSFARPLAAFSWVAPPLVALAAALAEPAILRVLPRFADAIPAAQIFALTAFPVGLERLAGNVSVVLGRQREPAFLSLALAPLALAGTLAVVLSGGGIAAVAWVALAVATANALGTAALACRHLDLAPGEAARLLGAPLARLALGAALALLAPGLTGTAVRP